MLHLAFIYARAIDTVGERIEMVRVRQRQPAAAELQRRVLAPSGRVQSVANATGANTIDAFQRQGFETSCAALRSLRSKKDVQECCSWGTKRPFSRKQQASPLKGAKIWALTWSNSRAD
jgi:hypothetical protein